MRRVFKPVSRGACAALAFAIISVTAVAAAASPFPATLTMQRGLFQPVGVSALPWGTTLPAAQARGVKVESVGSTYRWGVWYKNQSSTFPVRSADGGAHWTAAGPQLATDWAGGSLYYVTKVIAESPTAVVMVSNSIIDVTTDGGHRWCQYVNGGDNWVMVAHAVSGGGIGLRISFTSFAKLPKKSYAIYVLDVARHQWRRTEQSLR